MILPTRKYNSYPHRPSLLSTDVGSQGTSGVQPPLCPDGRRTGGVRNPNTHIGGQKVNSMDTSRGNGGRKGRIQLFRLDQKVLPMGSDGSFVFIL